MSDGIKKKILMADDDRGVQLILSKHLIGKGFDVTVCGDGQEALAAARQQVPDLVILDMMMPKLDGIKTCAMLKADKRYKNIPIIIATASADEATAKLSQQVGANGFVNKPLNMAQIDETIARLLPQA